MIIFAYIICVAFFIKFLHYSIGSPIQGEYYTGRIFSFYGGFISKLYKQWEEKESKRVWQIYDNWKAQKDCELNQKLQNASLSESDAIYKEYLKEIEYQYKTVETDMKTNPYSMMGACPICFGFWVGLFVWILICIFNPLNYWFIVLGSTTSTILSRYIKVQ